MNYLKTAASLCASILVLFSTVHAVAEEPTAAPPTASGESSGGNMLSTAVDKVGSAADSAVDKVTGFFSGGSSKDAASKVAEKTTEGTGPMGATGCPVAYESVATVTPTAEKTAGGLDCARAGIAQFADAVVAGGTNRVAGASAIIAIQKEYQTDWVSCQDAQSRAATVCIADNSDALSDGITLINGLLSAGGAASVYDSCTTFGKAMDIGQKALAAYTAACTVMRQPCVFYCGDVKGALVKMSAALKKVGTAGVCENGGSVPATGNPATAALDASCKLAYTSFSGALPKVESAIRAELDEGNIKSTGGKLSRCDRKYWQNVASAGVGILQLANSLKKGKECQDDSSAVADVQATCAIAANANLPECICLANPRTAGCSSGLSTVGELNAGSGQVVTGQAISGDAAVGSLGTDSTGISQGTPSTSSGSESGGIGAPTGGGPSLGSIGGGSGAGAGEKGAGKGTGLNTDILSGAGGGGVSGGGYGGRGGSSDASRGLRNYLPGGAKDPKRGLAGQGVGTKEVTGQAGKSNWEKVRDRYIDNKNSLIGN
jgi:hypothetical protein